MATPVTRRKRPGKAVPNLLVAAAPQQPATTATSTVARRSSAKRSSARQDSRRPSTTPAPGSDAPRTAANVQEPKRTTVRTRSSQTKVSNTPQKPTTTAKPAISDITRQAAARPERVVSTRTRAKASIEKVEPRATTRKPPRSKSAPSETAPAKSASSKVAAATPQSKTTSKKSGARTSANAGSTSTKAMTARRSSAGSKPQNAKVSDATQNITRVRRARVPSDFAAQYGETDRKKKRAPKETATARRARRDAETRERLRAIMTPDDNLLQRLARIGAIAPSLQDSNGAGNGSNGHSPRRSGMQTVRRPRKWESRCGKCGVAGTFKAAAGVCSRCGAIAVRQ